MSDTPEKPAITVKPPTPENVGAELSVAVNYLTRFSLPFKSETKLGLIRRSMVWFPLIGAAIGLFGALLDWLTTMMRMPGIITGSAAVIGMLFVTRALHEEEFANLVDAYSKTLEKNKPSVGWLKEERSVRYGTIGIIILITMKIAAIASLADNTLVFQTLIVAASWSRAMMVLAAAWLRPIEGDPVADHFQQPPALRVVLALCIGIGISYSALGEDSATILTAGTLAGLIVALIGANHLRGYSGSLLGALQQIVEITILGIVLAIQ
ncbi:MAG: adenosylcobinamide-GDP ribazoletransferase [Alphaproteobacteria bacterium]|nr:adenosylcobinamide-GDP ribazoletransferase [Alphaproteobacteria bacterium]